MLVAPVLHRVGRFSPIVPYLGWSVVDGRWSVVVVGGWWVVGWLVGGGVVVVESMG